MSIIKYYHTPNVKKKQDRQKVPTVLFLKFGQNDDSVIFLAFLVVASSILSVGDILHVKHISFKRDSTVREDSRDA